MQLRRLMPPGVFYFLLVGIAVSSVSSHAQNRVVAWSRVDMGTDKETVTDKMRVFRRIDGIEIEDVLVDGRSIIVDEQFDAGEDWISKLTFRVRNISGQAAARIQITVALPEMANRSPDVVYCYGCEPVERQKSIMPGDVVELKMLGGNFYEWVRERVTEAGLTRINKAEIHHMYVNFPTGPTWFSGCVKTTNPKNACPRGR